MTSKCGKCFDGKKNIVQALRQTRVLQWGSWGVGVGGGEGWQGARSGAQI